MELPKTHRQWLRKFSSCVALAHSDSTWPHSLKLAHERLDAAGLSYEVKYRILRGNAERVYRLTPSDAPADLIRP
jgi:hypothetical protein